MRPFLQLTSVVVCLWVFLHFVLSLTCEKHARSGREQENDSAIADYSTLFFVFFLLLKFLGCFCSMFWVIIHLSNQLCYIWLNLGRQYIPILQNPSGCFCLLSHHDLTPVTQCHWKPWMLMPSYCTTVFHR